MKKQYKATIELWLSIESEEDLDDDKAKVESIIDTKLLFQKDLSSWSKYNSNYDVIKIESDPIE